MKSEEKENNSIYYLPICKRCGDILKININPFTFEINYECENEGISNSLPIEKFTKKKLKRVDKLMKELHEEKNLPKYLYDEKENNYKKITKYFNNKQICETHDYDISDYCRQCKQNICCYCNIENNHLNHKNQIVHYIEDIPTNSKINNIIDELGKRERFIELFIHKLDKWKYEIIEKTEKLKNNLKNELKFMKALVANFNNKFLNYNYITNFNYIYEYLNNSNSLFNSKREGDFEDNLKYNNSIYSFYHEEDLSKRTLNLMEVFKNFEEKEKVIDIKKSIKYSNPYSNIICLNDFYFIDITFGKISILYFFKNNIKKVSEIQMNDNYGQIRVSIFDNKLLYFTKDYIYILYYNLDEQVINIFEKIQVKNTIDCGEIKKDFILIVRDKEFILWENKKIVNKINVDMNNIFFEKILPVNNECYITYTPQTIFFKDTTSLQVINQLNLKNWENKLQFIAKITEEYIIAVEKKMMELISVKTKEIVQIMSLGMIGMGSYMTTFFIKNKCLFIMEDSLIYKYRFLKSDKDLKKTVYKYNDFHNLTVLVFNGLINN